MRRAALLMAAMLVSVFAAAGVVFAQGSTTYPGYENTDPVAGGDTARSASTTDLSAAATVSNGGFEAGDLSGWIVRNQPPPEGEPFEGSWYAYSGTTSPLRGAPIAAPPRGSYAATTDQDGPGSHVLYKNITLESNKKHRLSFFLYYDNDADAFYPRNTLDYTGRANQQYRIDVLRPGADPFTVDPDAILATVFRTKVGDRLKLAPELRTFNLTPFAGRSVRLRFAEVDNQDQFLASVDQVKVTSVTR